MSLDTQYYMWVRTEVLELIPCASKRILDVGCAAGRLGEALKARQTCEVYGIEPFGPAAAEARARLDHVWEGAVEKVLAEIPDNHFDCVVLGDVLEHLVDPWAVLKRLREKVAEGGKIVASIPNVQNWKVLSGLLEGDWRYEKEGLLDRTHLRFFTRQSSQELFWGAGLRIVSMRVTTNGARPPKRIVRSLRSAGVDVRALEEDGRVLQHLVVAERPLPREGLPPKVAVVILNWNGRDDTLQCLDSVSCIDYPNYQVIVVDNGSTDDSVVRIRERFPEVVIVETGRNLGYAGGNNVGIREAIARGAEYVLVLNNDTVVDPLVVRHLVSAGEVIGNVGMLGAKVYSHDDPLRIQYAGSVEDRKNARFSYRGTGQLDDGVSYEEIIETPYVYGAAFLVSARAVGDVGLLDERYYLCHEETDWCNRMRKKGYGIYFVPQAIAWHRGSPSFGGKESPLRAYFMIRNRLLWAERNMPFGGWLKLLVAASRAVVPVLGVRQIRNARTAYWACRGWVVTVRRRKGDPVEMARKTAFWDYVFRRFGDCPPAVRRLNKEWTQRLAAGKGDRAILAQEEGQPSRVDAGETT